METTVEEPRVRVTMIEEEDAVGRTAELYERVKERTGLPFVPDMFRLASTEPRLLEVIVAGYGGIFSGTTLPRHLTELIAAWTSKLNGCPYCVGTHSWFLNQFGGSDELVEAVSTADTAEDLGVDEKTLPLMKLVEKVSTGAYKITNQDWDRAGQAGWSEAEILEAVFVASLFAFINRLVDATGLGSSVERSRIARQGDQ
ncbi:carboxymuconolactone decarboxylase family protein [Micromonospora sp. NPDC048935]|uniref:carboxymuconolactone decarboxylase family protein n=1 Tax=Micromonospora sp. NPDC048935 TaxID=3364262 RepID=UPI00371C721A